jgi:hypothetical protein
VTFVLLAVGSSACTQALSSTGASSSSVEGADASGEAGRPPPPAMADVVPLGDDGAPKLDGEHLRVPFFLPPPDAAGSSCTIHRAADAVDPGAPPAPPKDAPPPPDAAPPKDGKPGPLALQIALFSAGAGDAGKRPDVVVQCLAKPGEERIAVPRDVLDEALEGLGTGATARVILAGFPLPPEKPEGEPSADAKPPLPPMGRGVFLDVDIVDATSLDAPLARIALPKP